MAKARAIIKRRKAVQNIKKITRTMQLIATAKFQQCLKRATATRPYTTKLTELVTRLSAQAPDLRHPLLDANEGTGRTAVLVLTSSRGLCGSYNANAVRGAESFLKSLPPETAADLDVAGKKGASYFKFLKRPLRQVYTHFTDRVRFDDIRALADDFIRRYTAKEIDAVHVVYTKFLSASRQLATAEQLLPLRQEGEGQPAATAEAAGPAVLYDFSPPPRELLEELLPESARVRLFQFFTDSVVSEQVARLVARRAATDAAGDMIKILTRTYNRARQTQITMELLDILGGSEALTKA
jgi:F-type H+-transporting ATPase subunit gamma